MFFFFLSSFYLFFFFFDKKLICLLSLEMSFLLIIYMIFYNYSNFLKGLNFSISLMFLVFMVLDSVMGLSLLLLFCRVSNKMTLNIF